VALCFGSEADLEVETCRLRWTAPFSGSSFSATSITSTPSGPCPGSGCRRAQVVQGLRILFPVADRKVEVPESGGEIPFPIGLDALGEIDLRHGCGFERRTARPLVEIEVVRLAALRVRQDVHGFREHLKAVFCRRLLVGSVNRSGCASRARTRNRPRIASTVASRLTPRIS